MGTQPSWKDTFSWKSPDYVAVFKRRATVLMRIRANPSCLPALKVHYKNHPEDFISDWGCCYDPRNVDAGLPAIVPFILFPRQVEWIYWVLESWRARRAGVNPKTRESGVSWLAVALANSMCLHYEGVTVGFGSRKEEYVDKIESPKALFWKARKFIEFLPVEFRGGFNLSKDAPYMRLIFRSTGSYITGESGDSIGRGDRTSIYFVDEAAHLEHPESADAGLASTTNCRIDISTANGTGNPFHRKVTEWPAEKVFRFHWRDDPRKGDEWYAGQTEELDPVTLAQEVDIDFSASVTGVLIPSVWVQSAIDAARMLGIPKTGRKLLALDVADEGRDLCAVVGGQGVHVEVAAEWSGKGDDIFYSTQLTFDLCDEHGVREFRYDSDGLGAGVRGDARVINEQRRQQRGPDSLVAVTAFRGSGEIIDPEGELVKGRKNIDFFQNAKAQGWWHLRTLFMNTYRAVVKKQPFDPDQVICIDPNLPCRNKLVAELSQPTYTLNTAGKVVINKTPEGTRSPNLADGCMIRYAPLSLALLEVTSEAAAAYIAASKGRRR